MKQAFFSHDKVKQFFNIPVPSPIEGGFHQSVWFRVQGWQSEN
jgi:hypothetical protein